MDDMSWAIIVGILFAVVGCNRTEGQDKDQVHAQACAELGRANLEGVSRGEFSVKDALASMQRNGC
jgi:hypothetical protein